MVTESTYWIFQNICSSKSKLINIIKINKTFNPQEVAISASVSAILTNGCDVVEFEYTLMP